MSYLSHMNGCGVAVIQTHAGEMFGRDLRVLLHVRPQVRTVLGFVTIVKFNAVAPANKLSSEIHVRPLQTNKSSINKPLPLLKRPCVLNVGAGSDQRKFPLV